MNFGKIIKIRIGYFLPLFVFFVINIGGTITTHAQIDSSFSINRNGSTAVFPFKKFITISQLKNATGITCPLFGFNSDQINRIEQLLLKFTENEAEYEKLKYNTHLKDSIYISKEALIREIDTVQELRIKNYQQAYNSLLQVNEQVNKQLINCENLSKKEHSRGKLNSALYGILFGLSTGIIVGVVIR